MADHLDAPGLTSPAKDTRVDITDHYAFQKPGDSSRTVLITNVNPLAPTHADEFRSDAIYETLVDTDGDAIPNIAFRYRFTPKKAGKQLARVTRAQLNGQVEDGHVHGDERALVEAAPVSFGSEAIISNGPDHTGVRFFAGFRSDPFFFDLVGFLHGFAFTGSDFFVDKNVFGIALEVPNTFLGPEPNVGIWGRCIKLVSGKKTQIDRMGRPAINTVFNHLDAKNVFNSITPDKDRASFEASFVTTLESFGHSSAEATTIAEILLPDLLTYDSSSSAGFLNGRQLTDDVIDIELNLVTNGKISGDKVGPHSDYLSEFPYLGNPH